MDERSGQLERLPLHDSMEGLGFLRAALGLALQQGHCRV